MHYAPALRRGSFSNPASSVVDEGTGKTLTNKATAMGTSTSLLNRYVERERIRVKRTPVVGVPGSFPYSTQDQ